MSWQPISESSLQDLINDGEEQMGDRQARLWAAIRIPPEKWAEPTYGELGGGFWTVAVVGTIVVWYNDIEDGFNLSRYSRYGKIDEYLCNQDDLEMTIQQIIALLDTGIDSSVRLGPPIAGGYVLKA